MPLETRKKFIESGDTDERVPYRWIQAMVFTIKEINQNSELLPNITLGYMIYDSCGLATWALEGTMRLITGQEEPIPNYQCHLQSPLAAIIGDGGSTASIPMARLLGLYDYPQISYFASVPLLSDKSQFPSFFRTIPSDNFQSHGLAQLVTHFGWTWVGILVEDTEYGELSGQSLKEEVLKAGACIAFFETTPIEYSERRFHEVITKIKQSLANAIVVMSYDSYLIAFMEEVARQNVTGKVWIASEAWSTSQILSKKELLKTLSGTIGFAIRRGKIPGFKGFLTSLQTSRFKNDIFMKTFWEQAFGCKWASQDSYRTTSNTEIGTAFTVCTGTENLGALNISFFDVSDLRITYNVYNAVYSVAHALHDLNSCVPGEGPFGNGACAHIQTFEAWQLLHYVKNVNFNNNNGEKVFFDPNGNPPAHYDILNWQLHPDGTIDFVQVGTFDASAPVGHQLIINESAIMWNGERVQVPRSVCSESCSAGYRKAARRGQPICCFDCIPCSSGEISNQSDSTECTKCPDDQWSNDRQDKCIPKSTEFLSYDEPMGVTLASISIFSALIPVTILYIFIKNRNTPLVKANNRELSYLLLLALMLCFLCSLNFIGNPSRVACMLRQVAFGIVFALCVSCVLAKTIMVVIAFNATKPNSNLKKWVGPKLPNAIVFVCTVIQVIICIVWLSISPPFPEHNMKSQIGVIIKECNEGSTTAFWCMLGYMGLLAIVSFVVAFLAKNLPDSFNEAKFITFSMIVFVTVWLSFIPAFLSTRGKYMVAVEIFAILASTAGLLACIFLPKCYIILLRPHINTREYLMGKGSKSTKKYK
nr:PREDICTED: extracellular calcium-sensing receptor-like [Latimeria chalumnae]|eukprot:XP_006011174.2 PREDICTED: extracellular calcium-sensing receptor-like [Latimeria chalumnae]